MSNPTLNLGEQTIQRTASSLVLSFQPSRHLPRMVREDAQDRHFRGEKNLPSNLGAWNWQMFFLEMLSYPLPKKGLRQLLRDFETTIPFPSENSTSNQNFLTVTLRHCLRYSRSVGSYVISSHSSPTRTSWNQETPSCQGLLACNQSTFLGKHGRVSQRHCGVPRICNDDTIRCLKWMRANTINFLQLRMLKQDFVLTLSIYWIHCAAGLMRVCACWQLGNGGVQTCSTRI